MVSIDLAALERRSRRAYEVARLRRALLGVLPVVFFALVAATFSHRPESSLTFGLASALAGAAMLWYGRDPQRAVLPGVAAGLVPLTLALCANRVHACGPLGCGTLCVPACLVGGTVAGLCVAAFGAKRRLGPWYWVSATALTLLTGAMGCSCIGYSGLGGLGLGFALGAAPKIVGRIRSGSSNGP